jgi:hypothetical protein
MEGFHSQYPCQRFCSHEGFEAMLVRAGSSSMLNLHVRLIRLGDNVLSLLVDHLVLTMLSVHHGHLAAVAGVWWVTLLRTNLI